MELFLNICWLCLLVPAYLLWRQRSASDRRFPTTLYLCALGCAFVLLFPVISASDDLHAMQPETEESERAFRGANQRACAPHALTQSAQPFHPGSAYLMPKFERVGTPRPFVPRAFRTFSTPAPAGRAPPSDLLMTSL
jgi:hypothetical protein